MRESNSRSSDSRIGTHGRSRLFWLRLLLALAACAGTAWVGLQIYGVWQSLSLRQPPRVHEKDAAWEERMSGERAMNQAKWEAQHITHYRMTVDLPTASAGSMVLTVEVEDDVIVSVTNVQGQSVSAAHLLDIQNEYPRAFTIPGLFQLVGEKIAGKPPDLSIDYDPQLGYPRWIRIVPWVEPCCQDIIYSVTDFQALP